MMTTNNEEEISRLLKSAYKPIAPSPELREQLLERLTAGGSLVLASAHQPAWRRIRIWMPIAAAITGGTIAYGVWLSLTYH